MYTFWFRLLVCVHRFTVHMYVYTNCSISTPVYSVYMNASLPPVFTPPPCPFSDVYRREKRHWQ